MCNYFIQHNKRKIFPSTQLFWLEEAGSQKLHGRTANFCDPASFNQNNSGGVHRGKKSKRPQLWGGGGSTPEKKKKN